MTATDAYRSFRTQKIFGSLDGLRFLCILAVMWHHSPANGAFAGQPMLLNRGFVGVDFFFVLSGFLITTLLLREEERNGRFSLRGFYWRRILRIVPVYFLVVTLISGWYVLGKGRADLAPLVPYYYLFLANFLTGDIPLLTITWSLSVEEQYYLIWPALLLLLGLSSRPGRWRLAVLLALIGLCFAIQLGAFEALPIAAPRTAHAVFVVPAAAYGAILIGALVAVMLNSRRGFAVLWRIGGHRLAAPGAFLLVALLLQVTPRTLSGLPSILVHLAMALALATLVLREDNGMAGLLRLRPVARIGAISYGLYLYHLIGLHLANVIVGRIGIDGALAPWVVTPLFMLIAIGMAEVSFRSYERFFLRLKHPRRMFGRAADPTA